MVLSLVWIFLFCLNQFSIFVVSVLIISYLKGKALGRQTLFDLVVCDLLFITVASTTVFSTVIVLSRLNSAFPMLLDYETVSFFRICCLIYFFSYVLVKISYLLTCIVRIICIVRVGLLDDLLGDTMTIRMLRSIELSCSGLLVLREASTGGIGMGSTYKILSGSPVPEEFKDGGSAVIGAALWVDLFIFVLMQSITECQNRKLQKMEVHNFHQTAQAEESNTGKEDEFVNSRMFVFILIIVVIVIGIVKYFLPPEKQDDNIYLLMVLGTLFVVFVLCPIRFIEKTPSMRAHIANQFDNWIKIKFRFRFGFGFVEANIVHPTNLGV